MKSVIRIITVIIMLALMAASPAMAAAASPAPYISPTAGVSPNPDGATAFTLNELGMTVNIPNDLYVFTRDMTPQNTNPAAFGLKNEYFDIYFKQHDVYLNAVADQVSYEINISMVSPPGVQSISDFNRLSENDLKTFMQSQIVVYQVATYQYGTPEIYTGNAGAKFIKNDIVIDNPNGNKTYGVRYFTIHDGKGIGIELTTYSTANIALLMPMLTKLLDNATFAKDTVQPASPSALPSASAGSSASAQAGTSASKPSASLQPSTGTQSSAKPSASASVVPSAAVKPSTSAAPSSGTVLGAASGLFGFLGDNEYLQYGVLLLVTFILMTVPMLIYRFAVRKEPLNKGKGALVAGIDGLVFAALGVAYFLFLKGSLAILACVVLWAVVNFLILTLGRTAGREREISEAKEPETPKGLYPIILAEEAEKRQTAQSSNMTVNKTCKNCFAVNLATSKICFYCGAKLEEDEDRKDMTNV